MGSLLAVAALGCSNGDNRNPFGDGDVTPTPGLPAPPGAPQNDAVDADGDGIPDDQQVPDTSGEFCEEAFVRADRTTPDMMIVLDKSGSMQDEGRWNPSREAVKTITSELESSIRFGLMMFPGDEPGEDDPGCNPGELFVPVNLDTAGAIASEVNGAESSGGTPTGETLDVALAHFTAAQDVPDIVVPPQFVLLVTDGQPTCPNGDGYDTTNADVRLANDAIRALGQIGVSTYVIGYDTQDDNDLSSVLDRFATLGGTERHRAVENQQELLDEFRAIAGEIVSCAYSLEAEPEDPAYVQVKLDGQQVNLNDADGWSLNGTTVQLQGRACEQLQDGGEHTLSVQVRCTIVAPI